MIVLNLKETRGSPKYAFSDSAAIVDFSNNSFRTEDPSDLPAYC